MGGEEAYVIGGYLVYLICGDLITNIVLSLHVIIFLSDKLVNLVWVVYLIYRYVLPSPVNDGRL